MTWCKMTERIKLKVKMIFLIVPSKRTSGPCLPPIPFLYSLEFICFIQFWVNYPFKKVTCNGIYIGTRFHFLVICSLTFTSLLWLLPCTPAKHLHLCVFLLGWSSWLRVPVPAGLHGKTLRSAAKQVCQLSLPEWWTLPFTSHGLWVWVSVRIHRNQLWGEANNYIKYAQK